jgi:cation transport ATPase
MKHVTTFFVFMGIWFTASLFNGLLSGICLSVLDNKEYGNETLRLSVICSFIFSIPFVGVVWLVTTIAQVSGKKGAALFQLVLRTTFFCAVAGALFFIGIFSRDFGNGRFAVGASIIIAAVSAVLLFRLSIKGKEESGQSSGKDATTTTII